MDRIIFSDNGTLKDYTNELNYFASKTAIIDYTTATDYVFIGGDLPFNNKYIMVSSPNAATGAQTKVEYWDGTSWVIAIDVNDETASGDKVLAQSGHISWTFDDEKTSWMWDETDEMTSSGLETLKIFGLYWIRLSWNKTLTNTTALQYIGQKFSEDIDLGSYYPELTLSATKAQFLTGKTDWNDQQFIAADNICRDLQVKGIIKHKNQILDWHMFTEASIHKVAEIVFLAFGNDFQENRKAAQQYYNQAMKTITPKIDRNNNAILDLDEKLVRTGFMSR
jgi:hypothetical protein